MRKLLLIALLAIVALIAYIRYSPLRVPAGKVLVARAYLDSLAQVANLPPDTVTVVDTVWHRDTVRAEKEPPKGVDEGEGYAYADSLTTPDLSVWVWDRVSKQGVITSRQWAYRLHVPYSITREVVIRQPVPMPLVIPQQAKPGKPIRYYGMVGFGSTLSVDAGVMLKDRYMAGVGSRASGGVELKFGLIF